MATLRELVSPLFERDGHTSITTPDLCLYRFATPTTITKAVTFGVTMGVVLQGSKRVRVGQQELHVDPRRLLVITRETLFQRAVTSASPHEPYMGLSLCFGPDRVARALHALSDASADRAPAAPEVAPAFVVPLDAGIVSALERLVGTLGDPLDRKVLAPLITDEILYRLLRSDAAAAVRGAGAHPGDAHRILEAMEFIRANHTRKLDVPGLARRVAMSPSHFAHRFRAVARTSPMRYVREIRLDRARTLLVEHGARAGDVATRVGFESAAHFAREFKRRYGVPPSSYLRRAASPSGERPAQLAYGVA